MKRKYDAQSRQQRAQQTRENILAVALALFDEQGFEATTIDMIAARAGISASTIYARFKSKQGIVSALMDATYFSPGYQSRLEALGRESEPHALLHLAAGISRLIYESGHAELGFMRGAAMLSPELRASVQEAEVGRYSRQEQLVHKLFGSDAQAPGLSFEQARDLLWTLTGPDLYRMLVLERGWSPEAYESHLARLLVAALLREA